MNSSLIKQCVAEFIGTFALIFVGVGAIYHNPGNLLAIAFAHGLTIAVMVSATMGISGGQLNPAVTFGLFVGGKMDLRSTVAYWIAQLAGGSFAGFLLLGIFGKEIVANGTPDIAPNIGGGTAILIEIVLT